MFLQGIMSPEILFETIQVEISEVYQEHISTYCQYLEKIIEQYGVEKMNYKNRDVEVLEYIIDRNEIILPTEIQLTNKYNYSTEKFGSYASSNSWASCFCYYWWIW
ncbi:unnamed protein product [Blepharisma stoltei]|uniref:Uncharacterized protein n=1 Tax=Blepharisma stoltei TaxID=1481888 RepID=A0AAU9JPB7_9CILI|nr:unnamed protein product [Blepharisma stoltei]